MTSRAPRPASSRRTRATARVRLTVLVVLAGALLPASLAARRSPLLADPRRLLTVGLLLVGMAALIKFALPLALPDLHRHFSAYAIPVAAAPIVIAADGVRWPPARRTDDAASADTNRAVSQWRVMVPRYYPGHEAIGRCAVAVGRRVHARNRRAGRRRPVLLGSQMATGRTAPCRAALDRVGRDG